MTAIDYLDPDLLVTPDPRAPIYAAIHGDNAAAWVRAEFDLCETCSAMLGQPCLTRNGKPTRRHAGRGRR